MTLKDTQHEDSIVTNVAFDIGSGFTKIVSENQQHYFPSIVAKFPSYDFFGSETAEKITSKMGEWIIGESARNSVPTDQLCNTLNEDWAGSPGWFTLLYAGLTKINLPSSNIRLITGIPQAFYADKAKRAELVEKLKGKHEFLLGTKNNFAINIVDVKIIPQASGAMFCRVDQDNSLSNSLAGIIDVGTYTTGLCATRNGEFVHNKAGGVCMGVSVLADKCALFFRKEHNISLDLPDIYEVLHTKKVMISNTETDVSQDLSGIAVLIAEPIIKEIYNCWGNAKNMRVFVAGGGAPYFIGAIRNSIPHAELMDDNFFAVAKGMYLYLKAKSGT